MKKRLKSNLNKKQNGITKIQFAFTKRTINLIENLLKITGASSKADIVRESLSVYEWVVRYISNGYSIRAIKDDHQVEAMLPQLSPFFNYTYPSNDDRKALNKDIDV